MELFIAGGCGEHGRNCFYVEQNGAAFLVDCGLLAGAEDDLPRLNAEQIQKLQAVDVYKRQMVGMIQLPFSTPATMSP